MYTNRKVGTVKSKATSDEYIKLKRKLETKRRKLIELPAPAVVAEELNEDFVEEYKEFINEAVAKNKYKARREKANRRK
jgi:hypothetical protein